MRHALFNARFHRAADIAQPKLYALLLLAVAAAVLPFFLLTLYAHPSADDFCYASAFRNKDFWSNAKGEYLGWKGRYSAIFLTAAYHELGGMLLTYRYALLLFLGLLAAGIYAYVVSLTEGSGSRLRTLTLSLGFGALYFGTMPMVPATLYWLDGAFQYQTGGIFALLALSALFALYRTGTAAYASLACLCVFLAIGASETAMITLAAVVALMAYSRVYIRPQARPMWTAVVIVTILSSALLILAPGNFVRAEHASPDAGRFWFAFSHAWFHGGATLASWVANPGVWLATALFVPVALRMAYLENVRSDANRTRLLLMMALIPGLVWVLHFVLWWAAATNPPGRMLNMMYLLFLAGWFAAVLEAVALTARRCPIVFTEELFPASLRLGNAAATIAFAAYLFGYTHVHSAYADLLYRAAEYDRTMNNRYARITEEKRSAADGRPAMVFAAVREPPKVLMYSDIQASEGNWRNSCFARYFGLESAVRR